MKNISLHFHFKASNTCKGTRAEIAVKSALQSAGLKVFRLHLGGHDLETINTTNGIKAKIEVKFSAQGKDGKWRATTIKQGCTDHHKSDFIIFVCQLPHSGGKCVSFVIPCAFQGEKSFIAITSNPLTYSGKYAQFREAWHLLV